MLKSKKYYDAFERSFLELCPDQSNFMNMGVWPATSIKHAQEKLVSKTLELINKNEEIGGFIELGSGWGGTRKLIDREFPNTKYLGINISDVQIQHAAQLNQMIPNTRYLEQSVETLNASNFKDYTHILCIESAFHFERKESLIESISKSSVKSFCLAEICVVDKKKAKFSHILRPTLVEAWSLKMYRDTFASHNFRLTSLNDVSNLIFQPMSEYVSNIKASSDRRKFIIQKQFASGFTEMFSHYKKDELFYFLMRFDRE